jgi:hypothetical protein
MEKKKKIMMKGTEKKEEKDRKNIAEGKEKRKEE